MSCRLTEAAVTRHWPHRLSFPGRRDDCREEFGSGVQGRHADERVTMRAIPSIAGVLATALVALPASGQQSDTGRFPPPASPFASGTSNTGALTYSVPIEVPPGRLGVTPRTVLTYNSQAMGAGALGRGWSLGIPSVRRATKRGVQYGQNEFVLEIDGEAKELIQCGAAIGCVGSTDPNEFRARIEDGRFLRLLHDRTARSWKVFDKSGLRFSFGTTPQSRQANAAGDAVFAWFIDEIRDPHGNTNTYEYWSDQGQVYLSRIRYTGQVDPSTSATILAPTRQISFVYELHEAGALDNYTTGFAVRTRYRLRTIEIRAGEEPAATLVGTYALAYRAVLPQHDEQLATVQRTGSNGSLLPQLSMEYTPPARREAQTWATAVANPPQVNPPSNWPPWVGDFDGDGRMDIAFTNPEWTFWRVLLARGSHFSASDFSTAPFLAGDWDHYPSTYDPYYRNDTSVTGDFNGDGKTDIARGRNGWEHWQVSLSTGSGFSTSNWTTNGYHALEDSHFDGSPTTSDPLVRGDDYWIASDFDGDGKTDMAYSRSGWNGWRVSISTGSSFRSTSLWSSAPVAYSIQNHSDGHERIHIGDFDGDGRTDIARIRTPGSDWHIALSRGDRFENAMWPGLWIHDAFETKFFVADFNGDGKSDVRTVSCLDRTVSAAVVHECTWRESDSVGSGFAEARAWRTTHRFLPQVFVVGDFDGDHRADVAFTKVNEIAWYIDYADGGVHTVDNCPAGASQPSECYPTLEGETLGQDYLYAADFTGTGRTDIAYGKRLWTSFRILADPEEPSGLLKYVSNGNNGVQVVHYAPSSAFANLTLPFVLPVVSSSTVSTTAPGWGATTQYQYSGGYYDIAEREFRGFFRVAAIHPDLSLTETLFHLRDGTTYDLPDDGDFKGRPRSVERRARDPPDSDPLAPRTNGLPQRTQTFVWGRTTSPGTYPVFVRLEESLDRVVDASSSFALKIRLLYNAYGEVTQETRFGVERDGAPVAGADAVTTTTDYNQYGFWTFRPWRRIVSGSTSGTARHSTFDYYANTGDLWKSIGWINGSPGPTVTYAYTAQGNVETIADAKNNVTTYRYDDAEKAFPTSVTYPATGGIAHAVSYVNDPVFAKPSCTIDFSSNKSCVFLDPFGRPRDLVGYVGNPSQGEIESGSAQIAAQKSIQYSDQTDPSSFPRYTRTALREGTSAAGPTWRYSYDYFDGLGRKVRTADAGEAGKVVATTTSFDQMGRIRLVQGPFFVGPDGSPPAQHYWVQYDYDPLGRLSEVKSQDGAHGITTRRVVHEGLNTTFTDRDDRSRRETRDHLGRIVSVSEAGAGEPSTTYTYNAAGDLRTIIDPNNNVTTYTYDSMGRTRTLHDPDLGYGTGTRHGLWEFEWDANGNVERVVDARGQIVVQHYDALNRLVNRVASNDPAAVPFVTYVYDGASIPNGVGRLARVESADVVTRVGGYDASGRPLSVSKTISGAPRTYSTSVSYDLSGRLKDLTYPDGYVVQYAYHPGTARVSEIAGTDGVLYAAFPEYDPAGRPVTTEFGNGTVESSRFDPTSGKEVELNIAPPGAIPSIGDLIHYVGIGTSADGDVASRIDYRKGNLLGLPGNAYELGAVYDERHRISSERLPADSVAEAPLTFRAPTPDPGVAPAHAFDHVSVGGATYAFGYDLNGNTTTGWKLSGAPCSRNGSYDVDNRLISARVTCATVLDVTFGYDHGGTRVKKASAAGTTFYVGTHFEVTVAGGVHGEAKYIVAGGARIAKVTSSARYFLHRDRLGSTVAVSDASAAVVWRGAYTAFGHLATESGQRVTNYLYTGKELDPETGLYYFGARYYDPILARFTTPDSVVADVYSPRDLNRFAYARNNPLRYIDPTGHSALDRVFGWLLEEVFDQSVSVSLGNTGPSGSLGLGVSVDGEQLAGFSYAEGPVGFVSLYPAPKSGPAVEIFYGIADHTVAVFSDDVLALLLERASSGRYECMNNVACLGQFKGGPVLPDNYWIKTSELQVFSFAEAFYRAVVQGEGGGDWGSFRVALHPLFLPSHSTRGDFFVHGGAKPGSAGCIDIGGGLLNHRS